MIGKNLMNKEEIVSPLFSIVIPNYKRVVPLIKAINSVREQKSYNELVDKIIVVDDKSDNIEEIDNSIKELQDDKIIHLKNNFKSNAAYTRNQGAQAATTDWICFLDSDDCFTTDKFVNIYNAIKLNGKDIKVYCNKAIVYFDGEVEDVVPHRFLKDNENISDYLFVCDEYMQTSTLTIHKSFFDQEGFNEKYIRHQDYDLCLTLYENGYKIQFLDFVGTSINWGISERPTDKGESVDYSKKWIEENRRRVSDIAFDNFLFKFVSMKALRSGMKVKALKYLHLVNLKNISYKKLIYFMVLFFMPKATYTGLYKLFKKRKVNEYKKKNQSIRVVDRKNNQ